ncbi:hypothetical protein [Falsirhodobacter halotolerans]|uniref:hypothetical protein n=1 Tax=Falsirhodobacter halotolerans TaxID=1146892 RepID=UPI001FD428AE|nr:hypothetical protein [Falsirhodobacter halotolerans]MCJ8139586.1 hypothetical protein [Falsirhodobacter halotolerans]
MITHPNPEKPSEKTTYGLVRSGKNVGLRTYRKLVDNLVPVNDGLFGGDISQTFAWLDDPGGIKP